MVIQSTLFMFLIGQFRDVITLPLFIIGSRIKLQGTVIGIVYGIWYSMSKIIKEHSLKRKTVVLFSVFAMEITMGALT